MISVSKLHAGIALGVVFLLGMWGGAAWFHFEEHAQGKSEIRLGSLNGELTNPLLECEIAEDTIGSRKEDFTPELNAFVEDLESHNGIREISVYYRDLNNGPVIGVDQTNSYAPASLLKVPILISYLKWAEDKPGVLEEKVTFTNPVNVGYVQEFAPTVPLEVGRTYTTKELLETMIKYSDNQAVVLLFKRLPASYQKELYELLGVDADLITDPSKALTIRQYSIFFRVLFNASFLTRENSEYALDLLTRTTFENGVRAGVPYPTTVAHKFGERKTADGLQQFHDCGIVYYPKHPYLLCVMTRGTDVEALVKGIASISEFVYKEIDRQYGSP